MTIGIVGLGLIGGSFAKSFKANTDHRILGLDTDIDVMTMAALSGAVDGALTAETLGGCDVVLAALPPAALLDWAEIRGRYLTGTIVVDLCGVKREICRRISACAGENGFVYVGGHPMAGKEVGGFSNASAALFSGATMILTPEAGTDIGTLDRLKQLFTAAGFDSILFSDPESHDRIIAYTSALPHVISSAFVKSPAMLRRKGFTAGSFRDITRVAQLDENLWTELFLMNSDNLADELALLIENLTPYLDALRRGDAEKLRGLLREGRECRAAAGG